jgi:hypothetical protein
VRRWTRTDKKGKEHYQGDAGLFLRHLKRNEGMAHITHPMAMRPHVQHLVEAGHVQLDHHPDSNVAFTARLTATGKQHASRLIRSEAAKRVHLQSRMFKAAPSVTYTHPVTGERRQGAVHSKGAQGAFIVDHETKQGHRVNHGAYFEDGHTAPKEGAQVRDWRQERPGLHAYPDADTPAAKVKQTPTGLQWTDKDGKKRHGHDRAAMRQTAGRRFRRLQRAEVELHDAEDAAASDMRLGARSSRAAMGAALLAELYGADSEQVRPGRHLLAEPPKPEALDTYLNHKGLKLKTVRRWAATREWLDALDGSDDHAAHEAAKVAGRKLGIDADAILDRLDAVIGLAALQGMGARDMSTALMEAAEMDPLQLHYEPDEADHA